MLEPITTEYNNNNIHITNQNLENYAPNNGSFLPLFRFVIQNNNFELLSSLLEASQNSTYKLASSLDNLTEDEIKTNLNILLKHLPLNKLMQFIISDSVYTISNKLLLINTLVDYIPTEELINAIGNSNQIVLHRNLEKIYNLILSKHSSPQIISSMMEKALEIPYFVDGKPTKYISDKSHLFHFLIEKGAVIENKLSTIYTNVHASVKLECSNCSKGGPMIMSFGLYPYDEEICAHNNDLISTELKDSYILGFLIYFWQEFNNYLKGNKVEHSYKYVIRRESEKCFSNNPFYIIENISYDDDNMEFVKSLSFNISQASATKIINKAHYLSNNCDKDYKYNVFGNNCIDFVHSIYKLADLEGDPFHQAHPSGYPHTMAGTYKFFKDIIDFFWHSEDSYNF